MRVNKLEIDIDYRKFYSKYQIISFKYHKEFHERGDGNFYNQVLLDVHDLNKKIISLVYRKAPFFYVLMEKSPDNLSEIRDWLSRNGFSIMYEVNEYKTRRYDEDWMIFQLLLNAQSNFSSSKYSFNNISGNFIYYFKDDELDYPKSLLCFKITITNENVLRIQATTANRMDKITNKDFEGLKSKKSDFCRYEFGDNGTLKRTYGVVDENKQYIFKAKKGKRTTSNFLDVTSIDYFEKSRIAVLHVILKEFKRRYSDMVSLEFEKYDANQIIKVKKSDSMKHLVPLAEQVGFVLVNKAGNEYNEKLDEVEKRLKRICPNADITRKSDYVEGKLNIGLIHSYKFYKENGIKDQHTKELNGRPIQHITIEDFVWRKPGKVIENDVSMEVIIKEVLIKNDLINKRFTVVDWTKYDFKNRWTIMAFENEKRIVKMEINPDGSFQINHICSDEFNDMKYARYIDYFFRYIDQEDESKGVYRQGGIALIELPDGRINLIRETPLFTLPDPKRFGDFFDNFSDDDVVIERDDYIQSLTSIKDLIFRDLTSNLQALLNQDDDITRGDIRFIFNDVYKEDLCKDERLQVNKIRRTLYTALEENTEVRFKISLRNSEHKYDYYSSALDIRYALSDQEVGKAYYSVGTSSTGINLSIPRAARVREIIDVTGNDEKSVFFNNYLELLNVNVVRHKMPTVYPFPLKYINEYIKCGPFLQKF